MNRRLRAILVAAGAFTVLAAATPAAQAVPAVAGEFAMPGTATLGTDNEIVMAPDGNMWVTTGTVNGVARFTPDGTATFFPLGQTAFGITVGPDGNLWASQATNVAKIDPATGAAVETPIGGGYADGRGITTGPDGKIWIIATNRLARIDPAAPAVGQDVNVITTANPKGMTTGTDGLLWYADGDKVVSATATDTPTLTNFPLGGGVQDVAAGPNTQVAYANPGTSPHSVGMITPGAAPQVVPISTSDPFGVVYANDGAYWVARSSTDDLLRLAPDGTTTTLGGFSISGNVGPRKVATGADNTLWVTLDQQEKVAKVTGVEPPPVDTPPDDTPPPPPPPATAPETTLSKVPDRKVEAKKSSGKAKVKFVFSATGTAPSFQCTLTPKGKDPRTGPCTSPKKYKLKPGKYRFAVAATADTLVDESPATAKFKVVEP